MTCPPAQKTATLTILPKACVTGHWIGKAVDVRFVGQNICDGLSRVPLVIVPKRRKSDDTAEGKIHE